MRKCYCGHEFKEGKEPCIFQDNCKGCALCEQGFITVFWCENEECNIKYEDFDDE
ncbi:hypothetical protein OH784_13795 [Ectobacillus funiculus]|uniref:hypothetical protein n=1 Tax=Ectobacillus funiculus TaxID=137993 RepID=UPI00397C16AA